MTMWEAIKDWWFLITFCLTMLGGAFLFVVTTWLQSTKTKDDLATHLKDHSKDLDDHLKDHAEALPKMTVIDCQAKGKSCSDIIQLQLNQGQDKFDTLVQALDENKRAIQDIDRKGEKRHDILLTAILSIQGRHDNTLSNMRSSDPVQKRIEGHAEEPTI